MSSITQGNTMLIDSFVYTIVIFALRLQRMHCFLLFNTLFDGGCI